MVEIDTRPDAAIRLEKARLRKKFATAKEAADYFGWNYDTYIQHERGERGITRAARKYAKAYGVSEGWLRTGEGKEAPYVPIVGLAGANPDGSVAYAEGQGNLGEVMGPANTTPRTVALEVSGDSMHGIANDGSFIFYDERREPPTPDLFGEVCVVGLRDGRVLVKTLLRGHKRHHYDLQSVAGPLLTDVPVEWAALVTAFIPRKAARKL